jgi:hypothetical protein
MVCWRRDGLGLATSTSRRPLRNHLPMGQASFQPGRVGMGGHFWEAPEKSVARRFDAACRGRLTGGRLGRKGGREGGRRSTCNVSLTEFARGGQGTCMSCIASNRAVE